MHLLTGVFLLLAAAIRERTLSRDSEAAGGDAPPTVIGPTGLPDFSGFDRNLHATSENLSVPTSPGPKLLIDWTSAWTEFWSDIGPAFARVPPDDQSNRFLVAWEKRWPAFKAAVRPALSRSRPRLAFECPVGARRNATSYTSILLHVAAILVLVALPVQIHRMRERIYPIENHQYEVIYYSGEDLPQIFDLGGKAKGAAGTSGGAELRQETQVIRIARGNRPVDTVADAPQLKLPPTKGPIANLLNIATKDPGTAPAYAVHSVSAAARALPQPAAVPPSLVNLYPHASATWLIVFSKRVASFTAQASA